MDAAFSEHGIPVYHPRKTKFHMTLARVHKSYPTDKAVAAIQRTITTFGQLFVCRMSIGAEIFEAEGGCGTVSLIK